ncbi:hypothetical protein SBA3_3100007 [Candidatus Sulfopaludibacter sp. SbA3]|nr:hypothetical protein SBA3_3100007 [Candidatus Sulfopaludibacter sp. SbA3]
MFGGNFKLFLGVLPAKIGGMAAAYHCTARLTFSSFSFNSPTSSRWPSAARPCRANHHTTPGLSDTRR